MHGHSVFCNCRDLVLGIRLQIKAAESGKTKYTAVAGSAELRVAIAHDLATRKGTPYSQDDIVVRMIRRIHVKCCVCLVVRSGALF